MEEYCLQVKRCIEIALNCVEYDKSKRPTVGYIIHELNQTEPFIHETLEEEEKGDIISKPGELDTVIYELSISHNSRSESTHSKRPMIHSGKEVSLGLQTVEEKKDGGHDMDKVLIYSKFTPHIYFSIFTAVLTTS